MVEDEKTNLWKKKQEFLDQNIGEDKQTFQSIIKKKQQHVTLS